MEDTKATISFNTDEDATLLYFYVDEGSFTDKNSHQTFVNDVSKYINNQSDHLPFAVKEDGKWKPAFTTDGEEKQVTDNAANTRPMYSQMLKEGDNTITITGLKPAKDGAVWMPAIDSVGNISDSVQRAAFTTEKGVPEVTTLPEVSGVYGDEANTLKVTTAGVAEYHGEEISGSWKVTGANSTVNGTDLQEDSYDETGETEQTYSWMLLILMAGLLAGFGTVMIVKGKKKKEA